MVSLFPRGTFNAAALPNADIIAFVRDSYPVPGYCLFVIWAGQDQVSAVRYGC